MANPATHFPFAAIPMHSFSSTQTCQSSAPSGGGGAKRLVVIARSIDEPMARADAAERVHLSVGM